MKASHVLKQNARVKFKLANKALLLAIQTVPGDTAIWDLVYVLYIIKIRCLTFF